VRDALSDYCNLRARATSARADPQLERALEPRDGDRRTRTEAGGRTRRASCTAGSAWTATRAVFGTACLRWPRRSRGGVPMTFKFLDVDNARNAPLGEAGGVEGLLVNGISRPPDGERLRLPRLTRARRRRRQSYRRASVLAAVASRSSWTTRCRRTSAAKEPGHARPHHKPCAGFSWTQRGRPHHSDQRVRSEHHRHVHERDRRGHAKICAIPPINWIHVNLVLQRTESGFDRSEPRRVRRA
jgi:hypothetical protein